MQWFKHDADASNDAKLRKLRIKYGAQGYGIYWYCLELIARNVEKHNLTFELEHDAELIADDFKLSTELVQHIMTFMVDIELFENSNGIITCLKMASRTDEYTHKLISNLKNIPILSGQNPKKSALIEQNRIEQNRKEKKNNTPLAMLIAMGLSESLAKDWLSVRKLKKSAPTKTAFEKIKAHAEANGYTFEQAIKISVEQSWAGFNVNWIETITNEKPVNSDFDWIKV